MVLKTKVAPGLRSDFLENSLCLDTFDIQLPFTTSTTASAWCPYIL